MKTFIFVCFLFSLSVPLNGASSAPGRDLQPFQIARPSDNHKNLEPVASGLDRLAKVRERITIISIAGIVRAYPMGVNVFFPP